MDTRTKHIGRCSIVLAVSLTATAAMARPDVRTMTCRQAQSLVEQAREIVLTTGQYTYDKFVSIRGNYCDHPYVPTRSYVATADTGQCLLYICEPATDFDIFED